MKFLKYSRKWNWPQGQRIALSVGVALEAFRYQSQFSTKSLGSGKINRFSLSYGDYGWKAGIWRILETLDRHGIKGHVSVSGQLAERHPEAVAVAAAEGHEIAGHGWVNDVVSSDDDPQAELEEIRRCTSVLREASGHVPVGWTGPGSTGTAHTLGLLRGQGYLWNGDDASDDLPFSEETENGPIVIMPRVNSPHNDLTMWLAPRNPPDIIWEGFRNTFDQLYAEGTGGSPRWIEITLHSHIAGRPTLQPVIRKCLEYAQRHEGVWFARRREIAEWTLERQEKTAGAADI